jgi:hypothetical protein
MKNVLQELNLVTLHHETIALVMYTRTRAPLEVFHIQTSPLDYSASFYVTHQEEV